MGSRNVLQGKGFSPVFFGKIKNGANTMALVFVYVFCLNLILSSLLCVWIIVMSVECTHFCFIYFFTDLFKIFYCLWSV